MPDILLSILLKSYWNVWVSRHELNERNTFNSFKVLLELIDSLEINPEFYELSILLKSYWNRGDFSSKLLKE